MATIFARSGTNSAAVNAARSARTGKAFSFSRLLNVMSSQNFRLDGYERELLTELANSRNAVFDQQRVQIPLQLLADPTASPSQLVRDLSKGTLSAAGYLVGTETAPVVDLLRPWSVAARAGVTVIPVEVGPHGICHDIVVPRTTTGMTAYWLTDETTSSSQSDPAMDKVTMRQKTGSALTKFSRLLAQQSDVADSFLQREMLATVGQLLDTAILAGTGATGQPLGIKNHAGINTASGAFAWTNALVMEENAASHAADDQKIAFLTTPAVRKLLKGKTLDAGNAGEPLWKSTPEGEQIAGRRAHVASYAPTSSIIAGPWNDCILAMWGTPTLEINPYDANDYKAGIIQARIFVDCDVAVAHPAAWSVHNTVS